MIKQLSIAQIFSRLTVSKDSEYLVDTAAKQQRPSRQAEPVVFGVALCRVRNLLKTISGNEECSGHEWPRLAAGKQQKTENPRPFPSGRGFSAFLGGMYMKIKTYKQINIIRRKTVLQIFYQAQYIKAAQALHSGKTGYFQLNWSFVWKRRPFQQDLPEKYVFLHGQYGVCYGRLSHSSLYTIKNSIIQPKATAAVAIPAIR